MYISEIKEIKNYRNLSEKEVSFDKSLNFIIGENNIGKTNILELINILFGVGKFAESDFNNVLEPIRVVITIKYEEEAIGFFEDNFDVDDSNAITLIAKQDSIEERIIYYHDTPNLTKISSSIIRKLNVVYYYAQRMPSKEIDFRKTSGSGRVLNYLIQKSLSNTGIEEKDVLNRSSIDNVIADINKSIKSINSITGDSINAYLDPVMDKIICRILMLGDENGREIGSLGEGIQYAFNILLQIIDKIYNVKITRKPEEFNERLLQINGKKLFPIFLILDEPEIHQHPYRQRSLMKKIERIMNNDNEEFILLLQELFEVDGLIGQIFIATHSPNILLNDYKQFVRIYKKHASSEIDIISGQNIELDNKLVKHMLHNYLYLKEAMFSKCIIFVEGDTENGALPVFAKRKKLDLDYSGIGVVKLDGADSVIPCMQLYSEFGIKAMAIIDRDKESSYGGKENVYFTTEMDYEEDVYSSFELIDYLKCCKELEMLKGMISSIKQKCLDIDANFDANSFLEDPENAMKEINLDSKTKEDIMSSQKDKQLEKLKSSKNASKGAVLAEYVTTIPKAFDELIDLL